MLLVSLCAYPTVIGSPESLFLTSGAACLPLLWISSLVACLTRKAAARVKLQLGGNVAQEFFLHHFS
jgi:hypothetical protein